MHSRFQKPLNQPFYICPIDNFTVQDTFHSSHLQVQKPPTSVKPAIFWFGDYIRALLPTTSDKNKRIGSHSYQYPNDPYITVQSGTLTIIHNATRRVQRVNRASSPRPSPRWFRGSDATSPACNRGPLVPSAAKTQDTKVANVDRLGVVTQLTDRHRSMLGNAHGVTNLNLVPRSGKLGLAH